jgi:hypothetical protein
MLFYVSIDLPRRGISNPCRIPAFSFIISLPAQVVIWIPNRAELLLAFSCDGSFDGQSEGQREMSDDGDEWSNCWWGLGDGVLGGEMCGGEQCGVNPTSPSPAMHGEEEVYITAFCFSPTVPSTNCSLNVLLVSCPTSPRRRWMVWSWTYRSRSLQTIKTCRNTPESVCAMGRGHCSMRSQIKLCITSHTWTEYNAANDQPAVH